MASSRVRRQRILLTGASSGLGEQLARLWAADGRDLALCARRLPELERLRDELLAEHPGRRIVVHALDVTDPSAVAAVFEVSAAELGGLDRVVANAGIARGGSIGTGHAAENRSTAETNFLGVLNQAEAALSIFRRQGGGHLVVMSSMAALRGMPGWMNVYAATKAGVANLAEGIRSDVWGSDLRVTAIHPGYIRTAINEGDPAMKWSVDVVTGSAALLRAIEAEPARAYVPARPWAWLAGPMRVLPLAVFRRLSS